MMTRVMLCFSYSQALYAAEDRQGSCYEELTPCVSQVLGLGKAGCALEEDLSS